MRGQQEPSNDPRNNQHSPRDPRDLEGEGVRSGQSQSGCGAFTGGVTAVGGYWRLEMRLVLVLGYGNAFAVESRPECLGGGGVAPLPSRDALPPPPKKEHPARSGEEGRIKFLLP